MRTLYFMFALFVLWGLLGCSNDAAQSDGAAAAPPVKPPAGAEPTKGEERPSK